jgi:hypothetical protein
LFHGKARDGSGKIILLKSFLAQRRIYGKAIKAGTNMVNENLIRKIHAGNVQGKEKPGLYI